MNPNRKILALKEKDGLTPKEISELLMLPVSRIKRVLRLYYESPAYEPKYPLAEAEIDHIMKVLAIHEGNKTRAARDLGISLRCLRYKINAV